MKKKPIIKQRKSLDLVNELEIDGNVISKEKKRNVTLLPQSKKMS